MALAKKIAAAIANKNNPYAYLTGKELVSLTKSKKVAKFNLFFGVDQYTEEGGNSFYPSLPSSISVTRRNAVEVAEKFAKYDTTIVGFEIDGSTGEQLYAKVYISDWRTDKWADKLYIVL